MQKPATKDSRVRDLYEQPCINTPLVDAIKQEMLSDDAVAELALKFEILSSPTRIKIIHALSRGELCVYDLAQLVGMGESAVSHQLRLLRNHCLAKYRDEGKMVFYSLGDEFIRRMLEDAVEHL
ncbi:MAG TPA: metalloregulator ArsR/SmtB family transcription factor [Thermodesulfobacteriota bacterium]|nr:metalloregulator ArsR/SmtB family transcription factor [Thermodesulfobacteriota bacterium]